jgi:hypothetical protein
MISEREDGLLKAYASHQERIKELENALKYIVALSNEWSANKMGSVDIHRRRWLKMANIAEKALAGNGAESEDQ